MTDLNVRAAQVRLYGLVSAMFLAIFAALAITVGAFAVSFAVQRDLAHTAMLPPDLAWIIPAIVDTTIFVSTVCVVVLNKIDGNAAGRNFFVFLACAVIAVSVWSNGYHAYHAATTALREIGAGADLGFVPLDPRLAVSISVIPPLLVLAWPHGVGLVIKAIGDAYADFKVSVAATSADGADVVRPHPSQAGATRARVAHDVAPAAPAPATCEVSARNEVLTVDDLLRFLDQADPDLIVKETARVKIGDPGMPFADLAAATGAKAASTALRRYKKAEAAALAAGFTIPPLPDLDESALATEVDSIAQPVA
ncbi:uncharacterized protein DUF2637 [Rhodococcus sp. SMB37]|uniref:DUF2637 domain-containing protein n=1 Tax=Rhodococcus sp. SMB37 TaxID=2512213 RepID=UPI001044C573|nr:DUF2637 domain-containing protein [Rhodococcus sp. SMB37]TCN53551.1 uncharacterized protein DUF2637 [Rhodococcus sp. SMB37]